MAFGRAITAGLLVAALELAARAEMLLGSDGWGWTAVGVFGWVVLFAGAVGGAVDLVLRGRWWPERGAPLFAVAAFAGWVLSVSVHPSTYPTLHLVLDAGLVVALLLVLPGIRWPRAAYASALVAVVAFVVVAPHPGVTALRMHGLTSDRVVLVFDRLLDRDGDGYAPDWWLGGADCDNGDPERGPHAAEVPGNGIDDNCIGGDLAPIEAPPVAARGPQRARNLVVVSLCTFRDVPVGAQRPPLFALRSQTRWAVRNRAQAPQSAESIRSTFTSRSPTEVIGDPVMRRRLKGDGPPAMLVDIAKAAGFRSAYAHHGFERAVSWMQHAPFDAEFRDADRVDRALGWLRDGAETRSLLWFHLNYPHAEPNDLRPNVLGHAARVDRYQRQVVRAEAEVVALFAGLEPHWHDTALVLFADHGEAFGENGYYFHGYTPHEVKIRTPLMMRWPGFTPGPVSGNTGNFDVLPTALDALGLRPTHRMLGRSWLQPHQARPVWSEVVHRRKLLHRTVVDASGRWKLWTGFKPGFRALYDLSTDPDERFDVSRAHPDVVAELERVADRFYVRDPSK